MPNYIYTFFIIYLLTSTVRVYARDITRQASVDSSGPSALMVKSLARKFIGRKYERPDYKYDHIDPKNFEELTEVLTRPELTYSLEGFDCVTFVEVVLALSLSNQKNGTIDQDKFSRELSKIRYHNSSHSFIYRNHFTSADWIPHNKGLVIDITGDIYPRAKDGVCEIDRLEWILTTHPVIKKFKKGMSADQLARFKSRLSTYLQSQKYRVGIERVNTPYIPTMDIINNPDILKTFPKVGIVNIVRPNWNLKKTIGTNLNISHLGFVIRQGQDIKFIHASSSHKKIVETDLIDYLHNIKDSPTIKGINVLSIEV